MDSIFKIIFYSEVHMPNMHMESPLSHFPGDLLYIGASNTCKLACALSLSFSLAFVHVFVLQTTYVEKRFAEPRSLFLIELF